MISLLIEIKEFCVYDVFHKCINHNPQLEKNVCSLYFSKNLGLKSWFPNIINNLFIDIFVYNDLKSF